jgi:hypothetical protein
MIDLLFVVVLQIIPCFILNADHDLLLNDCERTFISSWTTSVSQAGESIFGSLTRNLYSIGPCAWDYFWVSLRFQICSLNQTNRSSDDLIHGD